MTIKVASIFSGCGGADLGITGGFNFLGKRYLKNDVEVVHASDIDAHAIETYNKNFKHQAVVTDARDIRFDQGLCDLLIGGFPCQSFSTVNPTKNPDDDRGQLYRELVRLAVESQAKVVIGENVKGFFRLKNGFYFNNFRTALESSGYRVSHQIVRAHDYGVPQKRERLFVVAFREDLDANFEFPKPTSISKNGNESFVPLGKVIEDLTHVPQKYYFSEKAVAGVKAAKNNMKRAVWQDLNEPCLTITSHLAKASLNSRDPVLLVDPSLEIYRRFTPREAARIQGFPDKFILPQSDPRAYRQIGNAISPIVMWHITKSVIAALEK